MAEGQKAAEQTRSALSQIGEIGDDLRKNINSYADNLIGGNKSHSSTGIHPDAQKAGKDLEKGANDLTREAGQKIDELKAKHK